MFDEQQHHDLENCADVAVDFAYPGEDEGVRRSAFQEASRCALSFLLETLNFIAEGRSSRELAIRLAAVLHGVGHPALGGCSISASAARLGTTRANLSKTILAYQSAACLPSAPGQKSEKARKIYSAAAKRRKE